MKQVRRGQRIVILTLLSISVLAPIVFVSNRLKHLSSIGRKEFVEDLSSIKYRTDALTLNAIKQEVGESLKEPKLVVYKDNEFNSIVSYSTSNEDSKQSGNNAETTSLLENKGTHHERKDPNQQIHTAQVSGTNHEREERNQDTRPETMLSIIGEKKQFNQTPAKFNQSIRSQSGGAPDERIKEMKDQLIRAKAYLNFAPPGSNSHFVKDLKLRIKEVERAMGEATKDSDLPRSALQKMRSMEASLTRAGRVFTDCSAMASKLRAMTYNVEEQVRAQKNQAAYLIELAARTTPKGFHCLAMQLTAAYFARQPEEREFPNQKKLQDPALYHYAVFSDNVLACAVVVNSTVSSSKEPEKVVFHVVTDSLNLPAISMWFLINPPGNAIIQIQSLDNFKWLFEKYDPILEKQKSHDSRYTSPLNHLRFYLPDVFPALNKVMLLDHDVVVQKDLSELWSFKMKGKVIGAVETCQRSETSFRRMDMFINFSDPYVASKFDANACTWAFGMNLFDLQEWRRQNLTAVYHKFLHMGFKRPVWKAGSLPLGWVNFYNRIVALDKRYNLLGLGYDSGVGRAEIERAAVIHYDGIMKPWLDIGIAKYKGFWSKHVKYDHPYLQRCNIHE